jgi:hypothetical protein
LIAHGAVLSEGGGMAFYDASRFQPSQSLIVVERIQMDFPRGSTRTSGRPGRLWTTRRLSKNPHGY